MMTKEREVVVSWTKGDEHKEKVVTAHEFSQEETNEMLDKVFRGGDEKKLKKELIEKSDWGEE